MRKLSGPLLYRIDMSIEAPALAEAELQGRSEAESSGAVRARVARTYAVQLARLNLSARAYHRVLKVARTVAELAGAVCIVAARIAEAIHCRRMPGA